jgi:hypothetical protein
LTCRNPSDYKSIIVTIITVVVTVEAVVSVVIDSVTAIQVTIVRIRTTWPPIGRWIISSVENVEEAGKNDEDDAQPQRHPPHDALPVNSVDIFHQDNPEHHT